MYQPSVFCVKLQLHFGGDVHEIAVPAYGGAEPTVSDLMNVVERDFRVPRVLQNLVFHGQDLHLYTNEPLSRFGIKNGAAIRLVGRMAPPDMINQINAQHNAYSYQQPAYSYQQPSYPQQQQINTNPMPTYQTVEQNSQYYSEQFHYAPKPSVATQYDPPSTPQNKTQPPPTPQNGTPLPPTPQNRTPLPPTLQNRTPLPPTPTPNQGQSAERTNSQASKTPVTPKPTNAN